MISGLQGSGKTTFSGKLAYYLKKQNKKSLLVACDVYRPAAIEQLHVLGKQIDVEVFSDEKSKSPLNIAKKAIQHKVNYIAIGAFYSSKTKKTKYVASINILKNIKKLTKIPIVAIGGINSDNYKNLLLNKANFLAISSYIWNNKKYKPKQAIEILR